MGEKCLDYNNLQKNLFITTQLQSSSVREISNNRLNTTRIQ
jgi:hypothetical protein